MWFSSSYEQTATVTGKDDRALQLTQRLGRPIWPGPAVTRPEGPTRHPTQPARSCLRTPKNDPDGGGKQRHRTSAAQSRARQVDDNPLLVLAALQHPPWRCNPETGRRLLGMFISNSATAKNHFNRFDLSEMQGTKYCVTGFVNLGFDDPPVQDGVCRCRRIAGHATCLRVRKLNGLAFGPT